MDSAKLAVSEQGASPATRSAAAIPSNIRRTLEESNLPIEVATAIADRLDAPCEEVEKQVSTLLKLWTDKTTPANKEVVPADYARDLYRKWREANRRAEYWKAEHLAGNKALESALADLRESQSAREKAAREAAGVCKRISLSRCYNSEEKLAALSCEAAILKHFDLEAK